MSQRRVSPPSPAALEMRFPRKSTHMKWEHCIQSLCGFLGTKEATWTPFGLCFIRPEPQNQTCLEVFCPWAISGLPHRCHITVIPLGKLGEHWQRTSGDCCLEEAGTPPAVKTGWGKARGEPAERARFVMVGTPTVCLPVLPLSSPNLL